MQPGRYIGIMSGTSLDSIDAVVAFIDQHTCLQEGIYRCPIPFNLRQEILSINQGQPTTLAFLGQLDAKLGLMYANTVLNLLEQQQLTAKDIIAIGNHGQTVWHAPQGHYGFTLQLGDNHRVAALTEITTVGDFRRKDIALGGQGAPLVPLFHQTFLFDQSENRIVLNIGGIANISVLTGQQIIGFDTGPGNILLDAWMSTHCAQAYDKDAKWAKSGKICIPLLKKMLFDPYFSKAHPKSTGREYFNLSWIQSMLDNLPEIPAEDVQATLLELTVITITEQVEKLGGCDSLLVCGGGMNNPLIMQKLKQYLSASKVLKTDKVGISGESMEALAFAWLAARTLANLPGNIPNATGAKRTAVLGAIYPM